MQRIILFLVASIFFNVLALTLAIVPAHAASGARKMTALHISLAPPRIDGRLDDAIWQRSPVSSDFLQLDPVEGKAASEKTTVPIAYDQEGASASAVMTATRKVLYRV